ncbi:hypothetical protein FA09DRAFT_126918 [Tilletiopsis washingtonensis]|uniref:Uncharacterized protein n=1 Tax=Tilletiopsis washingtonensis TaxID=58919 RepID=A0A316Z360_9BASI|nr:hypothetical protein FA09DRAFT_126918 [Tilletiopsis washingtonensis]PWN95826.1 hypothetical protein FA09DRAFT_126918 [Tilletiopsis washingtonensis]
MRSPLPRALAAHQATARERSLPTARMPSRRSSPFSTRISAACAGSTRRPRACARRLRTCDAATRRPHSRRSPTAHSRACVAASAAAAPRRLTVPLSRPVGKPVPVSAPADEATGSERAVAI